MRSLTASPLKWLVLLGVPVVLAVVVLNLDSWGTFLLDVSFTLVVQIVIAAMLFGWLIIVIDIVQGALNAAPLSHNAKLGVFSFSVILALPLISIAFHRPIDFYDIIQTVSVIACLWLFEPLKRFFTRSKAGQTPRRRAYRPTASTVGVGSYANSDLYRKLLNKAKGDSELVERLVEYERKRKPYAGQEELMERAINRWEHDNG